MNGRAGVLRPWRISGSSAETIWRPRRARAGADALVVCWARTPGRRSRAQAAPRRRPAHRRQLPVLLRPSPPPGSRRSRPRRAAPSARPSPASHPPGCGAAASSQSEAPPRARRPRPRRRRSTASISFLTPERTSVAVSCTAAAPSIGVESRICSARPEISPSSVASSSERSNTSRSLPCNSSRRGTEPASSRETPGGRPADRAPS